MLKSNKGTAIRKVAISLAALAMMRSALKAADPKPHAGPDAKAAAGFIQKGQEAFDAGDMEKAQQAFSDAFDADPANVVAARALGIVLIRQDKAGKAAHPLEVAAKVKSPDRFLVLALASHRISTRVPMQAVKFLTVYFDAHPDNDEQMLNALGIALNLADIAGVKSALFTDASKTYKKLNTKLESTRPGEKRWGVEWMPAGDVDKLQSSVNGYQKTITADNASIQKLNGKIADTQRKKNGVPDTEGDNNQTQKKQSLQKQIDELQGELARMQKDLEDTQKTLDETKPKWPETIPAEAITLGSAPTAAPAPAGDPVTAPKSVEAKPAEVKPAETAPEPKTVGATPTDPKPSDVKPPEEAPRGPRYAAAFAVSPELLVTASSVVTDASEIKVQVQPTIIETAEIVRSDAASGLTLLRVKGQHFNALLIATECKSGAVKCEGFPDKNLFGPVLGEVSGAVTVDGKLPTAKFDRSPRLPGGPLISDGKVVAVEMADGTEKKNSVTQLVSLEDLKKLTASEAVFKTAPANYKMSVFQITAVP